MKSRFILLFLALVLVLHADEPGSRPERWAAAVESDTLKNFYCIDTKVYRSAQPDRFGFSTLKNLGITNILNLRDNHSDRRRVGGPGFNLYRVEAEADDLTEAEIVEALRFIRLAKGPILIHCWHGSDRTGAVAAMYRLVFQNWTKSEAIDELINGGYGYHAIYRNILQLIRETDVDRLRAQVLGKRTAAAATAQQRTPLKLKPFTLALDWTSEPDYLGAYYAEELGLFAELGLQVEIREGEGSTRSAAAVAAGTVPLAFCSGGATVLSWNQTSNLVSLAVLYPRAPTVVFGIAAPEIKSLMDLKGKRIGIYPGSINQHEWTALLQVNGLRAADFTVVPLHGPDLPPLLARTIDAALNYATMSPTALALDPSLPVMAGRTTFEFALADYGVRAYGLNLVTSRQALQQDGPLIRRVAAAIVEGYRRACARPDAAMEIFCQRFPAKDPAYVKRSWEKVCALLDAQHGQQTETGWQQTIDTYRKTGLLKSTVRARDIMP